MEDEVDLRVKIGRSQQGLSQMHQIVRVNCGKCPLRSNFQRKLVARLDQTRILRRVIVFTKKPKFLKEYATFRYTRSRYDEYFQKKY